MSGAAPTLARRAGAWLRRTWLDPEPPTAALEVRGDGLGLVRVRRSAGAVALESAASLDLPNGTLRLSMSEPNVLDAAAFHATLSSLLSRAGALGGAKAVLVLPDAVARVRLLPAAEMAGGGDLTEMVRFRLRATLPFDVREAQVAARRLRSGDVLAVAMARRVLTGYEEACRGAGLDPGLVEVATLALAGEAPEAGDQLIVNWDAASLSFLVLRDGEPLLFRGLDAEAVSSPEQVRREATTTVLYYSERLGGTGISGALLRCGVGSPEAAVRQLEGPLGVRPRLVQVWGGSAGLDEPGQQALAGAMAAVRRRPA